MNTNRRNIGLLCAILAMYFSWSVALTAQERLGFPYHEYYSPEAYNGHSQIFTIAQDKQGYLYFANAFFGIASFDGTRWHRITIPDGAGMRIVHYASDHRVYAGGIRSFGYLAYDEFGFPYYEPLHTRLPEEISRFGQIWSIFEYKEHVYFNSYEYLYRYHKETGILDALRFEHDFLHVHNVGNRLFTTKAGVNGVYEIKNESPVKLQNSEKIPSTVLHAGLVTALQDTLLLVRYQGFLRVLGSEIVHFPTELDALWEDINATHAVSLPDGNIAVSTALKGIYIISPQGKIKEHYHSENILDGNRIFFVHPTNSGSFWAGSDNGIYRIDYGFPFRLAGRESNISSSINAMAQLGDTIYFAKSSGLAFLDGNRVESHPKKDDIGQQAFYLLPLGEELLIAGNPYLATYTPATGKQAVIDEGTAFQIMQLNSGNTEVLAAFNNEIRVYRKEGNQWVKRASYDSGNSRIYSVLQTQNRDIVLVGLDRSVHHLIQNKDKAYFDLEDTRRYTREELPDGAIFVHHIHHEDLLFFNFELARTIRFDHEGQLDLTQKSRFNDVFKDKNRIITLADGRHLYQNFYPRVNSFVAMPGENRWLLLSNNFLLEVGNKNGNWLRAPHASVFFRKTQARNEIVTSMFANENRILLAGPGTVLWEVATEIPELTIPKPEAHITRIRVLSDTVHTYANHIRPETFPSVTRELHFQFSTSPVVVPNLVYYRYKLDGYEDWSEWTLETQKEYNNLRHGSYRFYVQSVDLFQQKSEPFVYAFVIEPPIYLTTTAYIIYLLIFFGFVGLILQVRSTIVERALRKEFEEEKRRLEEIRITNELADARAFQLSLLPPSRPNWQDVEILFDMETATEVGGDYYDFIEGHDGARYVVIGDASGHGTAAGMMVSITKTALISIVAKSPKDGLHQINQVLKSVNRGKLNMALSIIQIDTDRMCIASAGMPPVYYYAAQDQSVTELALIGLPLGAISGAVYEQKEVPFSSGDFALCISDGLVETQNEHGETLGYDAVLEFLKSHPKITANEVIRDLKAFRKSWAGSKTELEDDLTFVLIQKK